MYSLTKATELFVKYYLKWSENISDNIISYNTHKIRHTLWVLEVWRMILIKMNETKKIDTELSNKAEMTFLLHDIARFFQNNKQRILTTNEFDHWIQWYKILINEWFDIKTALAVKYHDKYNIDWLYIDEEYLKLSVEDREETVFLAKLVRDADKIQNMIYSIFNPDDFFWIWQSRLPNWDISQINIDTIKTFKPIIRENVTTYSDLLLSIFCRIFDIYFPETIDILNFFWYNKKMFELIQNIPWVTAKNMEEIKFIIKKYE